MIEGRYVKNGEITEVFLPNGLTQLIVEEQKQIQAFTFLPRKVKRKRNIMQELKDLFILISLMLPIIPVTCLFFGIGNILTLLILIVIGGVWDAIVILVNNPL